MSYAVILFALVANPPAPAQDVDRVLDILRGIAEHFPDGSAESGTDPRRATATVQRPEITDRDRAAELPWFFLRQGAVVRGTVKEATLGLETPYGKLEIPAGELIEVRFFVRPSAAARERIAAAIADLGADDFEVRDTSSEALRELFPESIPALRESAGSETDEEIRLRVEKLLEEAESFLNDKSTAGEMPLLEGRDRVVAETFALEGVVDVPHFTVATPYGELRLSRRDLVRVVFRTAGARRAAVSVAASNVAPGNWLSTRVEVRKGEMLRIRAEGTMQVPSYGESSGPEGGRRSSRMMPGFRMLALVGKIGKSGAPFLVGRQYAAKAGRSGTLYLGIVPFRYDTPIGSYKATVEVK